MKKIVWIGLILGSVACANPEKETGSSYRKIDESPSPWHEEAIDEPIQVEEIEEELEKEEDKEEVADDHGVGGTYSSGVFRIYGNGSGSSSSSLLPQEVPKQDTSLKKPKTYTYDPSEYDDPEEYADDAYGVDYDDWDEAYDAWFDY